MRQLPGAGSAQNDQLNNHPSNNTRVCRLGLISEIGLSLLQILSVDRFSAFREKKKKSFYPLEDLLLSNVGQASVQTLNTCGQALHRILVAALDFVCFADD